jgi:hypothetical protein
MTDGKRMRNRWNKRFAMARLYGVLAAEAKRACQCIQGIMFNFVVTTRNVQKVFNIGSLVVVPQEHYDQ